MSVSDAMTHRPEIVLSVSPPTQPVRQTMTGPRGPATVDYVEARKLAIGGPAGAASLFVELREDLVARIDTVTEQLTGNGHSPLLGLSSQLPEMFQPLKSEAANGAAAAGGDEQLPMSALLIFDTREAKSGIGIVVPHVAALSARKLWLCEESAPADLIDTLSDALLANAYTWARHERHQDASVETDEVLKSRDSDRPGWGSGGGGFGRLRAGFTLPDFAELSGN